MGLASWLRNLGGGSPALPDEVRMAMDAEGAKLHRADRIRAATASTADALDAQLRSPEFADYAARLAAAYRGQQ